MHKGRYGAASVPGSPGDAHAGGVRRGSLPALAGAQPRPRPCVPMGPGRNGAGELQQRAPARAVSQHPARTVSAERSPFFFKVSGHRLSFGSKKNLLGFLLVGEHCCLLFSHVPCFVPSFGFPSSPTFLLSKIRPGFLFRF